MSELEKMEKETMKQAEISEVKNGMLNLEPADDTPFGAAFEKQDNWKHRSESMRCGTCMFFVEKSTTKLQMNHLIGRCRALAPTMKGWPVVFSDDWCGAHKLDEEKI